MEPSVSCRWLFAAAAAALCWKSVINMAAVSRSSIPSLLASICSNVPGSILMDGFAFLGDALVVLVLFLPSD